MGEKKTEKEKNRPEIDVEVSAKGLLGGFFKGLGHLMDLADKVTQEGGKIEKTGEFGIKGQKDMNGVYGFTIRTMTGPGGIARPVVRPFGDISKFKQGTKHPARPKGPVVEEATEPLADVIDEGDFIQVVAELPGVDESEITCEIQGDDVIQISTSGKKKYSKEILLGSAVDPQSLERHYTNGVLELKLKKMEA